jgi:hypothetical protein
MATRDDACTGLFSPLPGFEGSYELCACGRAHVRATRTGRLLSVTVHARGGRSVVLKDGRRRSVRYRLPDRDDRDEGSEDEDGDDTGDTGDTDDTAMDDTGAATVVDEHDELGGGRSSMAGVGSLLRSCVRCIVFVVVRSVVALLATLLVAAVVAAAVLAAGCVWPPVTSALAPAGLPAWAVWWRAHPARLHVLSWRTADRVALELVARQVIARLGRRVAPTFFV